MGDLLLGYDYKPQGELLLSYADYFSHPDPETQQEDAKHILGLFGGWGGLSDIVLADENGPSVEDNRLYDSLRAELYERMQKLLVSSHEQKQGS